MGDNRPRPLRLRLKRPYNQTIELRRLGTDGVTFYEVFNEEVYRRAVELAGPCHSIVDLGANVGLTSVYLLGANPNAQVLAVEASPDNWELLERNLASLTREGRAIVVRAAVWDADRTVTGHMPGPKHYNSFTVSESAESETSEGAPLVQGRTLQSLLDDAGFGEVDLLKVDIEGAEVPLLRTASTWLHRIRTLAVEFHGSARNDSNFDLLMDEHGFDVLESGSHTVVARSRRSAP